MPSDRARGTYDANQQYRSVVMQQGRGLLEADWNEQQEIAAEALRAETRELVGPSGTPDDGYRVFPGANREVIVSGGTMYVGGVRVTLPKFFGREPGDQFGTLYSQQPDWMDAPPVSTPAIGGGTTEVNTGNATDRTGIIANRLPLPRFEIVWLEIFEQEISAVED